MKINLILFAVISCASVSASYAKPGEVERVVAKCKHDSPPNSVGSLRITLTEVLTEIPHPPEWSDAHELWDRAYEVVVKERNSSGKFEIVERYTAKPSDAGSEVFALVLWNEDRTTAVILHKHMGFGKVFVDGYYRDMPFWVMPSQGDVVQMQYSQRVGNIMNNGWNLDCHIENSAL